MNAALLSWKRPDEAEDNAEELLKRAHDNDAIEAFSEQFVLGLRDSRLGHRHLRAHVSGDLVGLAAVAENDVEVVVDPRWRGQGIGTQLVRAVREDSPSAGFWAHGNLPAAQALAHRAGLEKVRRLLVMRIAAEEARKVSTELPSGFELLDATESARKFGAKFVDEQWLHVNNDAFHWHPEQGGWDAERLARAREVDWYDPAGVLLVWDVSGDEPRLAGFHWTKVRSKDEGEVYVVALFSGYRRQGLGGPLVGSGLHALTQIESIESIILFVEEDNVAAVSRYRRTGFSLDQEHVFYK